MFCPWTVQKILYPGISYLEKKKDRQKPPWGEGSVEVAGAGAAEAEAEAEAEGEVEGEAEEANGGGILSGERRGWRK